MLGNGWAPLCRTLMEFFSKTVFQMLIVLKQYDTSAFLLCSKITAGNAAPGFWLKGTVLGTTVKHNWSKTAMMGFKGLLILQKICVSQ